MKRGQKLWLNLLKEIGRKLLQQHIDHHIAKRKTPRKHMNKNLSHNNLKSSESSIKKEQKPFLWRHFFFFFCFCSTHSSNQGESNLPAKSKASHLIPMSVGHIVNKVSGWLGSKGDGIEATVEESMTQASPPPEAPSTYEELTP
jgi:hypothetical protein